MPRQPRLDIPGLCHHVIVRGIERGKIFQGDDDYYDFVDRLRRLLLDSDSRCYAWALIPNHFHLLLRPGPKGLAHLMRRLLTGYAVAFNRRNNRSGHLFQNRYKSIVCEEESYLLELIRYIHLNPLRAGLCEDLPELDRFLWCGHAEMLGDGMGGGLAREEVLLLFGAKEKSAIIAYRRFIEDGLQMGKRPDLTGGGLLRSRQEGGDEAFQDYDDRILGSGEFVSNLRKQGVLEPQSRQKIELEVLEQRIAAYFDLPHLKSRGRQNRASRARAAFSYVAVCLAGHHGAEVARYLQIGRPAVSRAVARGEQVLTEEVGLLERVEAR